MRFREVSERERLERERNERIINKRNSADEVTFSKEAIEKFNKLMNGEI